LAGAVSFFSIFFAFSNREDRIPPELFFYELFGLLDYELDWKTLPIPLKRP